MRTAVVAMLLSMSGCMKNTYATGRPLSGAEKQQKARFFLFGLVGEHDVYLDQICPDGVAKFENYMGFDDCLLGACTCSIYTPRTIIVTCASGNAFDLEPDDIMGVTWVEPLGDTDAIADGGVP